MRLILAGVAGFIGSHLADRLLAQGHSVVGVDSFLTGSPANIEHLQGNPRFDFVHQDVCEPFDVSAPVDGVLNLASPASPKDYLEHPLEALAVGSSGTRNLLEVARRHSARFLLCSTSECYGDPLDHPQSETYWGNMNPVGPRSCYDESKRFAEALTMAAHRTYKLRSNIARTLNTYGPRMKLDDGRVVPAFLGQALRGEPIAISGDGSQTRSSCYVSDMVEGLRRLMLSDQRYPVNLGHPAEMTILDFASRIQALTGSATPIAFEALPEDDPRRRQPDIAKAKRLLGWESVVTLDDGLRETIAYFRGLASAHQPAAVV